MKYTLESHDVFNWLATNPMSEKDISILVRYAVHKLVDDNGMSYEDARATVSEMTKRALSSEESDALHAKQREFRSVWEDRVKAVAPNVCLSVYPDGIDYPETESEHHQVSAFLDEVAVEGTYEVWSSWENVFIERVINPSWLDLCAVLENQMRITDDYHHQFLEGFNVKDGRLELSTGS